MSFHPLYLRPYKEFIDKQMVMSLENKEKILQELTAISDVRERFAYLIQTGKDAGELPEEDKVEKFRITGCNSMLWLVPEFKDGNIFFRIDSDAAIPKGIAAILAIAYSGMSPREVLALEPTFLKDAGIEQHLSMNRRNGLANICKQIKLYAMAFSVMN
jgi:cysteine desulfuration protein SufE